MLRLVSKKSKNLEIVLHSFLHELCKDLEIVLHSFLHEQAFGVAKKKKKKLLVSSEALIVIIFMNVAGGHLGTERPISRVVHRKRKND